MKKFIAALLTASLLLVGCSKTATTEEEKDSITVSYVDVEGKTVESKEIEFDEDDTLAGLVEENFENVKIDNGMLMTIADYETPADWSSFICIYVNDEMSEVGINDIELVDDMNVSLTITEYNG